MEEQKMTVEELKEQLKIVQQLKCETQNLELKTAEKDARNDYMTHYLPFPIRMRVELLSLVWMNQKIIKKSGYMIRRICKRK